MKKYFEMNLVEIIALSVMFEGIANVASGSVTGSGINIGRVTYTSSTVSAVIDPTAVGSFPVIFQAILADGQVFAQVVVISVVQ